MEEMITISKAEYQELISFKTEVEKFKSKVEWLECQLAQLKKMIFGTKSERFIAPDPLQGSLFDFPTVEVTAVKGSDSEKMFAAATLSFWDKWKPMLLWSVNQLPDLPYRYMTFVVREVVENGNRFMVITEQGKTIWKEPCYYEYFDRFMEIGEIFKRRYKDEIIDFVPDVDGYYLYGDKISSIQKVENFRRQLRSNN